MAIDCHIMLEIVLCDNILQHDGSKHYEHSMRRLLQWIVECLYSLMLVLSCKLMSKCCLSVQHRHRPRVLPRHLLFRQPQLQQITHLYHQLRLQVFHQLLIRLDLRRSHRLQHLHFRHHEHRVSPRQMLQQTHLRNLQQLHQLSHQPVPQHEVLPNISM